MYPVLIIWRFYMILYFSATGNSKYTAERIAARFGDSPVLIEGHSGNIELEQDEVFGIVTPVYFWELPENVREFLRNVTINGKPSYTFIVTTYGTTPGCTFSEAKKLLAKKGITLSAGFSVRMPDTWTPLFDLSDKAQVERENKQAEESINKLLEDIGSRINGCGMKKRTPYFLKLLSHPLYNSARKTKLFCAEDTCIGCGLCAGKCPAKAIEIKDKKPVWIKKQCILCFRCIHSCPEFAIQYKNGENKKHGQYINPNTKI